LRTCEGIRGARIEFGPSPGTIGENLPTKTHTLNLLDKVRLLQRVAADRARGVPWATITSREAIPERTLRGWLADFDATEAHFEDIDGVVRETLHVYDQAIRFFVDLAARADNSSAAVGAMGRALDAVRERLDLVAAVNRFRTAERRDLASEDAAWLVRRTIRILERHDVNPMVAEELLAAIEERRRDASVNGYRRAIAGEPPRSAAIEAVGFADAGGSHGS
jgi:hypothetical protein